MTNCIRPFLISVAICAGVTFSSAQAQEAEETDSAADAQELADMVAESTFVWLKPPMGTQINAESIQSIAKLFGVNPEEAAFKTMPGFVVPKGMAEALQIISQTKIAANQPQIDFIESNSLVVGFNASCEEDEGQFPARETPSDSVAFVGSGAGNYTNRVWLIDSGVSNSFDKLDESGGNNSKWDLNVLRKDPEDEDQYLALECWRKKPKEGGQVACRNRAADKDQIGHGTMLAGIIGAEDNEVGLIGVAPGVPIIPIKIFKRRAVTDLEVVLRAIDYVSSNALPGDVINISWGTGWHPDSRSQQRMLEIKLRDMAERQGVSVAIAAGNIDAVPESGGYVQAISPARAGGYRATTNVGGKLGRVMTASAFEIDSTVSPPHPFWSGSAFGNGWTVPPDIVVPGPPDFAEPGVNIKSLWPGGKTNICTGTSFAAPHLAGILVNQADPVGTTKVSKDPSAQIPSQPGHYDDNKQDAIGKLQ